MGTIRGGGKIVIGCKEWRLSWSIKVLWVLIFVAFIINRIALACVHAVYMEHKLARVQQASWNGHERFADCYTH